jgi:hypothetical protein
MNHLHRPNPSAPRVRALPVSSLALALVSLGLTGCYHATGFQRPSNIAEEIPAFGGDHVPGLKQAAGPGDYFLGNDNVSLAVDGTPFGEPEGTTVAGATSGGSIIDAGLIQLDQNYKRTPLPSDFLERLTPVVNQDPDLPLVFSSFLPSNEAEVSRLELRGGLSDPLHKVSGASWDAQNLVQGVEVVHRISLGRLDRYFLVETTLTNRGGTVLGIRNLGDALIQSGGGFRFNVPATGNLSGGALTRWGTDIPGTDFTRPLDTSVKAPMVALMAPESAGAMLDSHASLGIISASYDPLLVASDPQAALTEYRPLFSRRLVVGCQPVASLAVGASLTYQRRLYVEGGSTSANALGLQATAAFNAMTADRLAAKSANYGWIVLSTFGTATRSGSTPALIRVERNAGTAANPLWQLERTEWWETPDSPPSLGGIEPSLSLLVPEGTYRLQITNRTGQTLVKELFRDVTATNERRDLEIPLVVLKDAPFQVDSGDYLCPERDRVLSSSGSLVGQLEGALLLLSRPSDGVEGALQPARFTVEGRDGTADPNVRRSRALTGIFDPSVKTKTVSPYYTAAYQYHQGNQVFGVRFKDPAILPLTLGSYRVHASRGPLAPLDASDVALDLTTPSATKLFVSFEAGMPAGWTTFDLPGPSLATTGGLHPSEKLASALAEAVSVVGYTEQDQYVDASSARSDFRSELDYYDVSDDMRKAVGTDPVLVAGRTSALPGYGTVTSLFTPAPSPGKRRNGARVSTGWTLADFQAQAGGTYTVVHRPRGPEGLFTRQGFDPTLPLSQKPNDWWLRTSSLSLGRAQGAFDALELLRAEGCDPLNPTPWFGEFLAVRRDWFALLSQQAPTAFTKGLGLSSSRYSVDTPVGLARTYVKATDITQDKPDNLATALRTGALVASTGPLLDVSFNGAGPGGLATGSSGTLSVNLYAPAWVPVDEVRVVVNGKLVTTLNPASFTPSASDPRLLTVTLPLQLGTAKDAWIVVEAGVPLGTTGIYRAGTPWNRIMKGIYPIAVANPVFVDTNGGGYTPPGL